MKKKFKVILVVFLVVVLGCFSQAFAATNQNAKLNRIVKQIRNVKLLDSTSTNDGGVVGTSNLNGTTDNSAKVGNRLAAPEKGWKRYDDINSKIVFSSGWTRSSTGQQGSYNLSNSYKSPTTDIDNIKFIFYGTKLRILNYSYSSYASNQSISIDGTSYTFNENIADMQGQTLSFEKIGMPLQIHIVEITCPNANGYTGLDCIDIDSTGYLIDPSTPNPTPTTGNRATLTINMVNGSTKQYDLSEDELNSFLSWYNGMTNPLSSQCYVFNNPIIGPYLNNKDYITFNKIDDFKIQEYTK